MATRKELLALREKSVYFFLFNAHTTILCAMCAVVMQTLNMTNHKIIIRYYDDGVVMSYVVTTEHTRCM